ncbi:MAG: carbohydrate binding protein [Blastococcus sp.]|jgi:hypothetical protein|nr:carbohydrate binding protein [Blastococcus sp.]
MTGNRALTALIATGLALLGLLVTPTTAGASPTSVTKIGAWSQFGSWTAFDAAVGPVDVYRGYGGWNATWQQVPAGHRHSGGINDFSFRLPPAQVASGQQDAALRTFIASTPQNVVLTNHHEPEQEIQAGEFTFAQFRAANARLNRLVDEQNAQDGGTRKVSVVLMISTFTGFQGRNAENYWPTSAKGDGGTVDLISADVYAAPHATGTAGVPLGYTDGVNWKSAATLVRPVLNFAKLKATDWAISELGILEDVNDPNRRAQLMRDVVAYAQAGRLSATSVYRPALWVSYWNSKGGRADWGLRFQHPVPSESSTSLAFRTWRDLANQP